MADQPSFAFDTLCDTEALGVLQKLAVAMFTAGSEAMVVFGTLKKLAGSQTGRRCACGSS